MLYMLPLYCRIDLAVEHCCWHSNARATTQRIAAPPSSLFVAACFWTGWEVNMAGVLFVYEGVVARRCHRHRTRPCVFVCCAFYCCCCCCCCAGVYCVASVDVQSLVQFLSRFRIVTASFTAVGIPRWPEPTSPFSHFPPAPTSSGRGIFVVVLRQAGQID